MCHTRLFPLGMLLPKRLPKVFTANLLFSSRKHLARLPSSHLPPHHRSTLDIRLLRRWIYKIMKSRPPSRT